MAMSEDRGDKKRPRVVIAPASVPGRAVGPVRDEPFALRLARRVSGCAASGNWSITVRHGIVTRVTDPEGETVYQEGQWKS